MGLDCEAAKKNKDQVIQDCSKTDDAKSNDPKMVNSSLYIGENAKYREYEICW